MNTADIIVILVVILFGVSGYFRGFIRQFADFVALIFSVIISFALYSRLASLLLEKIPSLPPFLDNVLAISILWIGSQFIFYFIFNILYHRVPVEIKKSKANRMAGSVPGLLWGSLFSFVVVSLLLIVFGLFPGAQNYQRILSESASGRLVVSQAARIDNYVTNIFGGSLSDTLTFRTVPTYGGETVDLGFKTEEVKVDSVSEEKMLELINVERTKRGFKPLVMDNALRELARAHSGDMFARGFFAHVNPDGLDPFQRMAEAKIRYLIAGENLALAPTAEMAHGGLMNSPGHRANILTPGFGKVGIGCIDGGKYGKMFSQEFTN